MKCKHKFGKVKGFVGNSCKICHMSEEYFIKKKTLRDLNKMIQVNEK